MLHSCDVQSYENTSATLVRKGGIEKKGWMYCVTGEPNDVSYKNNTLIPGISVHYFPKDVAICPKWTRFDIVGSILRTGFEDVCYQHISLIKSGEDNQWIQLKRPLIKESVPTPNTIVQRSFRLTFHKRRMVSFLLLFISHAWDILILLIFPHDYNFAFLIVWKSYQLWVISYFNNRNTLFVMKFEPFPELTDILLREQCETSGGYWPIHKLEGAVPHNLSFRKSIPRAIHPPLPSRN